MTPSIGDFFCFNIGQIRNHRDMMKWPRNKVFNANGIEIVLSEPLFQSYCGLLLSGYPFGPKRLSIHIRESLFDIAQDKKLLGHFSYAFVDDGRINPYWPRAFFLTVECLLGINSLRVSDTYEYLLGHRNIGKKEITAEVVDWLTQHESFLNRICLSRGVSSAWKAYKKAVDEERENHLEYFQNSLQKACDKAFSIFPALETTVKIVLNPLQAWQLTDVVTDAYETQIVTSKLRSDSILHEILHESISGIINEFRELIAAYDQLLNPVFQDMSKMSYAWDESVDSWLNVYSETFVRVATSWILYLVGEYDMDSEMKMLIKQGFLYAPAMLSVLQQNPRIEQEESEMIIDSLDQCERIYQNTYGKKKRRS